MRLLSRSRRRVLLNGLVIVVVVWLVFTRSVSIAFLLGLLLGAGVVAYQPMLGVLFFAVTIPMAGFADSFNISVAASITLYEAQRQRRLRFGKSGDLSESDKRRIRAVWYIKSVRESRLHIERALANGYGSTGTE